MMELTLNKSGIDHRHPDGFLIDRTYGSGDFVFIHFLTPMLIHDGTAARHEPPGTCIIYAPPFRQWYKGDGVGLGNDWFHFDGRDARPLLRKWRLPVNRPFQPARTDFMAPMIRGMEQESRDQAPYWQEAMGLRLEHFFLELARSLREQEKETVPTTPRKRELQRLFRSVRSEIMADFRHRWTVADMARKTHLSGARFAVLYKEFFAVSPLEDLLRARLAHARWLLTNANMPVKDAAHQSGFENIYYFSRIFRRRVGCPPREYYSAHFPEARPRG